MNKPTLHTINGVKELDSDVAEYIKVQQDYIVWLQQENNKLEIKVSDLKYEHMNKPTFKTKDYIILGTLLACSIYAFWKAFSL